MPSRYAKPFRERSLIAALAVVCALCAFASADSLWQKRQRDSGFLFTDRVAADVGDVLTVLIEDESSFNIEGERESEKSTGQSGSIGLATALVDLTWPSGDSQQESTRTFEGSHDYNGTRTYADSITVTVIDKLPNANMVVAGRSEREVAGETTVTVLTGVIRPDDVGGTNTILSQRVAHLRVYYETSGPQDSYLRDGWLGRIVNMFWPF